MDFFRPTHVHIHLDRLMANFRFLRGIPGSHPFLCPMVKANAYGHGDVAIVKALEKESCGQIGVASVDEALNLRKSGVLLDILCFGFSGEDGVAAMLAHKVIPVVSSFSQLESVAERAQAPVAIHLKLNTGMNRLGFKLSELPLLLERLKASPLINVVGLASHFFSGENILEEGSSSQQQLNEFIKMLSSFQGFRVISHIYNSSAMTALVRAKKKLAYGSRPGLLVYGIDPTDQLSLSPLVSPVMEFKSKIVSTQEIKSGEVVSYGGFWQAPEDGLIGIVPVGYGDGLPWSLSNCGEALVSGKRCAIRGRVCMDYTMLDLSSLNKDPQQLLGEDVVFWGMQGGQEISLDEVEKTSGRFRYELLTGINERVTRYYGV